MHSLNICIISIHTKLKSSWIFLFKCFPLRTLPSQNVFAIIDPICVSVWLICSVQFFTLTSWFWFFSVKNFHTHAMCVISIQTSNDSTKRQLTALKWQNKIEISMPIFIWHNRAACKRLAARLFATDSSWKSNCSSGCNIV